MMPSRKIPVAEPVLSGNEEKYVTECIRTNWISSKGKFIDLFEEKFASYIGVKHAIAVSSGTAALHLALAALDIQSGDEIIMPTFTMIACANVAKYLAAKPVLVDSDSLTWNIDPNKIEEKITDKTKAIMVIHIYGHPADMDPIMKIAKRHGLYVVEDAAEAHGAEYKGKKVGGIGDIGCFSFYANKIITTGEGGALVTNNEEIAVKIRRLRDQAYNADLRKWLIHDDVGYNYRLTNLQAAVGVAQLERIEGFVNRHRENAYYYNSLLKDVQGITLPPEMPWAKNVYWMYTILVNEELLGITRDDLMKKLESFGIDTRAAFLPIHLQPPYKNVYINEKYPIAELLGRRGINLPSGNSTTKEDIDYIVSAINDMMSRRNLQG
ncbi:MAG: DegT/DnrJ/EryC1/StrS family aminotransferase [Candidatus Bathyarchaeia archaeon]